MHACNTKKVHLKEDDDSDWKIGNGWSEFAATLTDGTGTSVLLYSKFLDDWPELFNYIDSGPQQVATAGIASSAGHDQPLVVSTPKQEPQPVVATDNPEPPPQVVKGNPSQATEGMLDAFAAVLEAKIDPGFASTTAVASGAAKARAMLGATKVNRKRAIDTFSDDECEAGRVAKCAS